MEALVLDLGGQKIFPGNSPHPHPPLRVFFEPSKGQKTHFLNLRLKKETIPLRLQLVQSDIDNASVMYTAAAIE